MLSDFDFSVEGNSSPFLFLPYTWITVNEAGPKLSGSSLSSCDGGLKAATRLCHYDHATVGDKGVFIYLTLSNVVVSRKPEDPSPEAP